MSNYVFLNDLGSRAVAVIFLICFMALIFAVGFSLGRHFLVKDFENRLNIKFNQRLQKIKEALNKYLEEEGKDIRIAELEGVPAATGEKGVVKIVRVG